MDEVLQTHGISKSFFGLGALADVGPTLRRGEIHARLGGQGAGKSTLIKILSGALRADGGATTVGIYAVSGFLARLSGIVHSFYTSAGSALATVGVAFDAIAAVVIGGTLPTERSGLIAGTFVGISIMGLIRTSMVFDGALSSRWTRIGLLLFAFIALRRVIAIVSERRRPTVGAHA